MTDHALKRKRVLFVTYGGGHVHMVYPVVQALWQREAVTSGQLDVQVLAMPAAVHTLRSKGIGSVGFNDFLDTMRDSAALAWGRELAKKHHSPTIGVAYEDSVAYLGLCFQDLVERHGQAKASDLMETQGRQAFMPLTVMARIFDRLQPDLVVTTNSPRSEAAAIAVANDRGIVTMAMTDLFTNMGSGYLIKAKHVTFLNDTARQMFQDDGLVDPSISSFYNTGNPAFDRIRPREQDSAWMDRHFPLVAGRKVVLHADMPAWFDPVQKCAHLKTEEEALTELQACYAATLANGAAYLVRPHPSQRRALYERWMEGRTDVFLAAECDLHELLAHTDLLLARTTTVGLEAALMHRRVLQLDAASHPDLPLAAMGMAWGSRGMSELPLEVGHALADNKGFDRILTQIREKLPIEAAAAKITDIILSKLRLPLAMHMEP